MKIKGKKLESTNEMTIVLPRYNGEDVIFKATLVDFSDMEKILKLPKAPYILRRGKQIENTDDKGYEDQCLQYLIKRENYTVAASLLATPGLEWETVDLEKPETWNNCEKELLASGLPRPEVVYIYEKVRQVNSLDQNKLDEARDRFLLIQQEAQED